MRGGEGESQLESDRRRVQERIEKNHRGLQAVRRQRATQRSGRQRNLWPLASIVGYTNAGKSTLLNALTGAAALAEDKLFATLDPTTRRLRLPTNQNVFLTDTVGFIRKLPHGLVEAFKATLEEVVQAELLLHVVDVSHPQAAEQIAAVNTVLREIGAEGKPTIMVFNKIDRFGGNGLLQKYLEQYPNAVGHFRQNRLGHPGIDRGIGHPTCVPSANLSNYGCRTATPPSSPACTKSPRSWSAIMQGHRRVSRPASRRIFTPSSNPTSCAISKTASQKNPASPENLSMGSQWGQFLTF